MVYKQQYFKAYLMMLNYFKQYENDMSHWYAVQSTSILLGNIKLIIYHSFKGMNERRILLRYWL